MQTLDWNATIASLQQCLSQTQFQNWVKPVELIRFDTSHVVLGVPSRFHEEWIRNHYQDQFSEAIKGQCGADVQLEFEVLQQKEEPASVASEEAPARPSLRLVDSTAEVPRAHPQAPRPQLPHFSHPYFSLPFNKMAHHCSELFASGKDPHVNPLVILADTGQGKTHLLSDIGNRVVQERPYARVRYTNAETFTSDMLRALKSNDMLAFKKKYSEETDCLLFDDVQALTKRLKTQEALLHIFNEILHRGGQVAFTTTVMPYHLADFIDPLKSRLAAGILSEIKVPHPIDRKALLAQVAKAQGMNVNGDALEMISGQSQGDVRTLIGSLVRYHLQAKIENRSLDAAFLNEGHLPPPTLRPEHASLDEIVGLVEQGFGVSRSELTSKSRKGSTTWARQVAMYLARHYTLLPLEEIGRAFGRDHATVIHAFQKVTEALEKQPTRKYEVEYLKQKLQGRMP